VLLGILGGVEMFGLIGLFVGPVVMTLFVTLWHEENLFSRERE
jgi:predicted PurR-regulated permease PerM